MLYFMSMLFLQNYGFDVWNTIPWMWWQSSHQTTLTGPSPVGPKVDAMPYMVPSPLLVAYHQSVATFDVVILS
jgi:hypothetical protein